MKLIIGSDHAAFTAKNEIAEFCRSLGHDVTDAGTDSPESCDYPDFAARVAAAVASGEAEAGLLLCGSGIGMSIAANKVPCIRAALCYNVLTARLSRLHNNANVLCLGARMLGSDLMKEMAAEFLKTPFEGGRHAGRLAKIEKPER